MRLTFKCLRDEGYDPYNSADQIKHARDLIDIWNGVFN